METEKTDCGEKNTREEKTTRDLHQLSGHRGQVKKEMESRKTARATI